VDKQTNMSNNLQTWCISDTHRQHSSLVVPKNIDCVIHAGDSTNYYDQINNQLEFDDFIKWYSELNIKYKVLIAGNHDSWATKKYNRDKVKDLGVIYLEHEYVEIENKLIFGSPYTPTFGNWHFMKDRSKLSKYWEALSENIHVLITHGPCKGILDLSHSRDHKLEYCGDAALTKAVFQYKPKFHVFGHIHDSNGCYNSGTRKLPNIDTVFINASVVEDGKINQGVSSHGQIIYF
jgi:Icc-related predicted phosphoesterase